MYSRLNILIFILAVSLIPQAASSAVTAPRTDAAWGPYCGIYSVYAAARYENISFDFADLLRPQYCSSAQGSSVEELCNAAAVIGLSPVALTQLSTSFLRHQRNPVILHVRSVSNDPDYDHFVLFLHSTLDGDARIFDPSIGPQTVSFSELSERWDGNGIALSTTQTSYAAGMILSRLHLLLWATLAASVLFVLVGLNLPGKVRRSATRVPFQFAAIFGAALVPALFYNLISDQGLLRNRKQVTSLQEAFAVHFLPKISSSDLHNLIASGSPPTIVDARHEEDFQQGHIPKAINIPVNAGSTERRSLLDGVGVQTQLVVYCQSDGCPYTDIVVRRLLEDGYHKIVIFRGGWIDWNHR